MLGSDGHIKLTDFGSATNTRNYPDYNQKSNYTDFILKANTYCGTDGYMAPEMAYLGTLSHAKRESKLTSYTYTNAVDWWSVGATAYKLLTGRKCSDERMMSEMIKNYEYLGGCEEYIHDIASIGRRDSYESPAVSVSGGVVDTSISSKPSRVLSLRFLDSFKNGVSDESVSNPTKLPLCRKPMYDHAGLRPKIQSTNARSFIIDLLDVNFITRLGSGKFGPENVKNHPFFEKVDWDLVEAKKGPPVYSDYLEIEADVYVPHVAKPSLLTQFKQLFKKKKDIVHHHDHATHTAAIHENKKSLLKSTWEEVLKGKNKVDGIEFDKAFEKNLSPVGQRTWFSSWKNTNLVKATTAKGKNKNTKTNNINKDDIFYQWDFESPEMAFSECGLECNSEFDIA